MARKKETDDSVVVTAAKAIGSAAGKIASLAGIVERPPSPKAKNSKLAKKNKSRLPRRQKKAQQNAARGPGAG